MKAAEIMLIKTSLWENEAFPMGFHQDFQRSREKDELLFQRGMSPKRNSFESVRFPQRRITSCPHLARTSPSPSVLLFPSAHPTFPSATICHGWDWRCGHAVSWPGVLLPKWSRRTWKLKKMSMYYCSQQLVSTFGLSTCFVAIYRIYCRRFAERISLGANVWPRRVLQFSGCVKKPQSYAAIPKVQPTRQTRGGVGWAWGDDGVGLDDVWRFQCVKIGVHTFFSFFREKHTAYYVWYGWMTGWTVR